MEANQDGKSESRSFLLEMKVLAAVGCFLIFLYSMRFWDFGQFLRIFGVGMLVAGAALLSGFLLGFIFAIPRVGDKKGKPATDQPQGAQASDARAQQDSVPFNANLVEISDWLTKIIVGVGLVELHSIPGRLGKLSYYLAPGLQPAPCSSGASCAESIAGGQAVGLAILIFYSALGFLLGYVWTMIYFQGDLEGKVKDLKREKETEKRLKQTATRIWWAEASINANQLDKAMDSIDKALEDDPQNGYAVMTKARILKRQAVKSDPPDRERLRQAIACIDQAIALMPNKGEPVYNKACYQLLLDPNGLRDEVLDNLKAAFRLNPALRQIAKDDSDLDIVKQDTDFERLIYIYQRPDA
jgi:tetratricopeptide (TPR) repeat protein